MVVFCCPHIIPEARLQGMDERLNNETDGDQDLKNASNAVVGADLFQKSQSTLTEKKEQRLTDQWHQDRR